MTVEISRMIVHNLNLSGDYPLFNEECLDLGNIEDVEIALDFFSKHINTSRTQSYTKHCQFWGQPANIIKNAIDEYWLDQSEEAFVDFSVFITQYLRNIIDGTSSRSDGSIFVLEYLLDQEPYIGIMKMDPNDGIEVMDDLTIKVRKDLLPSPKEKLHKSAFIKLMDDYPENTFHLFALDRQQTTSEPAKFFMNDFLNVMELPNESNMTKSVQKEMLSSFEHIIPYDRVHLFNQSLKRRMSDGTLFNVDIHLAPIIREYLDDEQVDLDLDPIIQEAKTKISAKYPGATFEFEPNMDKINPTVYKSRDGLVEITLANNILPENYSQYYDEETGDFVLRIDRGLRTRLIR